MENPSKRIMILLTVKLLMLCWTVTLTQTVQFVESEDARSVPPKSEPIKFPHEETSPAISGTKFQNFLKLYKEKNNTTERTFQTNIAKPSLHRSEDEILDGNVPEKSEKDSFVLFEKLNSCKISFSEMKNHTHKSSRLVEEVFEGEKTALRHCNISEELFEKLKAKLPQLESFQGIFVLIPKNNSSESPDPGKSTQQTTPTVVEASKIYSSGGIRATAFENNLKLKLGDEWIPIRPKVSHESHIYLGSSVFPMLTEESRVLVHGHSAYRSAPTRETFVEDKQKRSEGLKRILSTPLPSTTKRRMIYRLEVPLQKQHCKSAKNT